MSLSQFYTITSLLRAKKNESKDIASQEFIKKSALSSISADAANHESNDFNVLIESSPSGSFKVETHLLDHDYWENLSSDVRDTSETISKKSSNANNKANEKILHSSDANVSVGKDTKILENSQKQQLSLVTKFYCERTF